MVGNRVASRVIVACALLGACAKEQKQQVDPKAGQIKFSARTSAMASADLESGVPAVCAQFTLQPYSLDASGNLTLAGAPKVISSTNSGTESILGCIDGPVDAAGDNWGYLVTASNFVNCDGSGPIAGLSPSIVSGNHPLDCKAGVDTPLAIEVNVSIPAANSGGFVDLPVTVNGTEVEIGCKQADGSASGGPLHFGESVFIASGSPAPPAYTALGISPPGAAQSPVAAGALSLYDGAVSSAGQTDFYVTGQLALPPAPEQVTLVQTYAMNGVCPAGQGLAASIAPTCVTQAVNGQAASTQAVLADLFAVWPGLAAVTGIVQGAQVTLYTSLGGPDCSTLSPQATGSDALAQVQSIALAGPIGGLWVDRSALGRLVALVSAPSPMLQGLLLDPVTGLFTAETPTPYGAASQSGMGLFAPGGCYPLPAPVCPQADPASCQPGPAAIAAPTLPGPSAAPSTAGCTGADYSTYNTHYFQFEPGAELKNSGTAGGGFNPWNSYPGWPIPMPTTGGEVGGYYNLDDVQQVTGDVPEVLGFTRGMTMEFLARFDKTLDFSEEPVEWAGSDGQAFRFVPEGDAVVVIWYPYYVAPDPTDYPVAPPAPFSLGFPMSRADPGVWTRINDGRFHHYAVTADLDANVATLYIDGLTTPSWTQPFPAPGSGQTFAGFIPFYSLSLSTNWWNLGFGGSVDELAYSTVALPPTLLQQHAQQAAMGQHYTFVDSCPSLQAEPQIDSSLVVTDFPRTADGQVPIYGVDSPALDEGHLFQALPLPRFRQAHSMPRMEHWVDPGYWFGWIPNPYDREAPSKPVMAELANHWNFYPMAGASTYFPQAGYEQGALNPSRAVAMHTFWFGQTGRPSWDEPAFDAAAFFPSGNVRHAQGLAEARADGQSYAQQAVTTMALTGNVPSDYDDILIVEDGESVTFETGYSYDEVMGSPDDAAAFAPFDDPAFGPACQSGDSTATCNRLSEYAFWMQYVLRQAFFLGFKDVLGPQAHGDWFNVDGDGTYYWPERLVINRVDYGGLSRSQPAQSFDHQHTLQYPSTSDFYPAGVSRWDDTATAGNDGIRWFDGTKGNEQARGDHLTMPFVALHNSEDITGQIQSPQALGLLKYLVTGTGAIGFHPGDFHGGDQSLELGILATASYVQAAASRVEPLLRASRAVFSHGMHGGSLWHFAGDPLQLVGVRQVLADDGTPEPLYVVSASIEADDNHATSQSQRASNARFVLDDTAATPLTVTLPARRVGSLYTLDLRGSAPLLLQHDAWHEDADPTFWAKQFDFTATESDDSGASDPATALAPHTEAPNLSATNLDFTGFTSFLAPGGPAAEWPRAEAALAPWAGYRFEPRSAWGTTDWEVWVRARLVSGTAADVYVNLDAPPGAVGTIELGCVSSSDWTWIRRDVNSGDPAAFHGISMDQPHELEIAPGASGVQISDVVLTPAGAVSCGGAP